MKTTVITGATSFIGTALLHKLLNEGVSCYALVRPESNNLALLPQHKHLHIVRADLADTASWLSVLPACDVFYHFAWGGVGAAGRADAGIQAENVERSIACLRAAETLDCKRFVFAGSQAEYGVVDGQITEDTPCRPVTEYGKAKLRFLHTAADLQAHMQLDYVHLRIFSVYGPGDHPWTLVSKCIEAFSRGDDINLTSCEQLWNFLYVTDAAQLIFQLGCCDLQGQHIFNVAGEDTRPLKQYVETIWRLCGCKGKPIYATPSDMAEKPPGIEPVVERLIRVTGHRQTVSFSDGIQTMLQ